MKAKIIGIVFLISASLATGQTLFGSYDCGEWFKKPQARAWLLGYLSGINGMVAKPANKYDPLDKLNSAGQAYLWMDNYCKANPLKKVTDGALDLYVELQDTK